MADTSKWDEIEFLARRARKGDDGAFRVLLEQHRSAVTSTLFACGIRCSETAKDLAQDVALRAWQNLDGLADARSFPAWLRRIAANSARDHLRRLAVRREDALDEALDLDGGDDPHERAERVAEVRLMLAALEDEDEEVVRLLLARADGVSVEALAREMGISHFQANDWS